MQRQILFNYSVILFATLSAGHLGAADAPNADAKMRETLRNTMLQLRTAEAEKATLQAAQAANDAKLKEAMANIEKMSKESTAAQEESEKTINSLKARVTEHELEIARFKEALDKWQTSQRQAADLAARKEGERSKLADEKIVLQRKVADQQVRNDAMFKLGSEILTRYEKFGLGDALTSREPFVGITRVKFQSLIQDFQDKLVDQKIKP
jgi:Fe-S cluster assembly scaffold protein SufB